MNSAAIIRTLTYVFFLLAIGSSVAVACPTCKENLAHDPASANLARGFYYSILFMLSMPPLIFGGLSAYFFWEVRRARAREAAKAAEETKLAIQA